MQPVFCGITAVPGRGQYIDIDILLSIFRLMDIFQGRLTYVRTGDALIIHSMDRLSRNLVDLLTLVKKLTGRGVAVRFEKEQLTFTGEPNAMQDLQLAVMGAVAQFERSLIKERQAEGIAAAKKKGKHLGRKSKLTSEQREQVRTRAAAGADKSALAKEFGISRASIYNQLAK